VFGFLGIGQIVLGNITGDEARIEQGRTVLSDAVHLFPPYINGIRALAFGQLPRTHAFFPEATEALQATLTACGEPNVDQRTTFDYPGPGANGSCSNEGIVAHVYEGFYLTYGDIYVKRGEPDAAKAFYENAKGSPTYDTWLLKSDLEARIAGAADRAALYVDADTANDPLTWMQEPKLCVGCHARAK
jgi:hypothetical protein